MSNRDQELEKFFGEERMKDGGENIKAGNRVKDFNIEGPNGNVSIPNAIILTKEIPDSNSKSGDTLLSYSVYCKVKGEMIEVFETDPKTSKIIVKDEKYMEIFKRKGIDFDERGETIKQMYRSGVVREVNGQLVVEESFIVTDEKDGKGKSQGDGRTTDNQIEQDGIEEKKDKELSQEELVSEKEEETGKKVAEVTYIESPTFYRIASLGGQATYKSSIVKYQDGTYEMVNSYGEQIGIQESTAVNVEMQTEEGTKQRLVRESFRVGSYMYYITLDDSGLEELSFNEEETRGRKSYELLTNAQPDKSKEEIAQDSSTGISVEEKMKAIEATLKKEDPNIELNEEVLMSTALSISDVDAYDKKEAIRQYNENVKEKDPDSQQVGEEQEEEREERSLEGDALARMRKRNL